MGVSLGIRDFFYISLFRGLGTLVRNLKIRFFFLKVRVGGFLGGCYRRLGRDCGCL